jgi:hypothetical protein
MKRLLALALALSFVAGCASPGAFDDALKDLRGDNMRMRSNTSVSGDDETFRPITRP